MQKLTVLSGGAAQGLFAAIDATFRERHSCTIDGTFGAVGMMRAKLADGHPADVVVLTAAILRDLAAAGDVVVETVTDIGRVETAIAVRGSDPAPDVGDAAALKQALLGADAIYFPDPQQATAGIHFASVMDRLGIADTLKSRLRTFPNGATAMRALASAPEARPIGCTQVTEILSTPGIRLIAPLPKGCDLATTYTAGVVVRSPNKAAARALIALLAGSESAQLRAACGFT
jgi:molybdate transport system substrate-binding protein